MERTEKKIVLCLIGRGPLEEKIKKEASDMGIQDDVRFFGVRSDGLLYFPFDMGRFGNSCN